MFFEGAEKKFQLICKPDTIPLRAMDSSFWAKIVKAANAEILSSISNEKCDAYLLSESSLFVWDDRFILITCGETALVKSALEYFRLLDKNHIQTFVYQRQNEFRSLLQLTSFKQDVEELKSHINGSAVQIGELDGHHHHFFTSCNNDAGVIQPKTTELKMYNLNGSITDFLSDKMCTAEGVREYLKIDSLFTNFIIDDFVFEPSGYSINGLKGYEYFTIHVTPQKENSYASLETNINLSNSPLNIFGTLLNIFRPVSWDVISLNQNKRLNSSISYWKLAECDFQIGNGINIQYENYHKPDTQNLKPKQI